MGEDDEEEEEPSAKATGAKKKNKAAFEDEAVDGVIETEAAASAKPTKTVRGRVNTPHIGKAAMAAATGSDDEEEEEPSPKPSGGRRKKAGFEDEEVDGVIETVGNPEG